MVTLAAVLFSLQADAFDYPVLLTLGGIALVLSILAVLTSASRRSLLTMGFAGGALALSALVVVIGIDAALTYSYVADVPGY
ncbi:hypothetical protein BAY61_18120 [Prauserella marina]|nr:hypothetical protein BAY61_18120 [Prauserella marina]